VGSEERRDVEEIGESVDEEEREVEQERKSVFARIEDDEQS
jgi:hypothetical protein